MNRGVSLAVVVALAKSQAIKYGALGIANIEENGTQNGILFTLVDGTQYDIILDYNATGISYNNLQSGLLATNVQSALDEIVTNFNNFYAFQIVRW